jgi:hypothetical protein
MGSGISLHKDQIIHIIERDLKMKLNLKHRLRPKYTHDGIEIFYGFDDEEDLECIMNTIKKYNLKNN